MTIEIASDIYWIGVNDRTTDLFEGMWPINDGVSYNCYLIRDEKSALIDLTPSGHADEVIGAIEELIDLRNLGYIIINHMEPDHSGILRTIHRYAPKATILGTRKAIDLVKAFYEFSKPLMQVEDAHTLTLGKRTLEFYKTPFVHWPETMMTFDRSSGVLFSGDGFGGFGAIRGTIFDDEIPDLDYYRQEALRYYANVIVKYSNAVLRAIRKLEGLPIKIVAPAHGVLWRRVPREIIRLYRKWAQYGTGPREKGVTLVYGSMYGNTERMMNAVARGIARTGLPLEIFDASRVHATYILPSMYKYEGLMVGTPTYETEMFIPVAHLLDIARRKRIAGRKVAKFGSYGWSGGAKREWEMLVKTLKWTMLGDFEFHGGPTQDELRRAELFGENFANQVAE